MSFVLLFSKALFTFALAFYVISCFQWFSYKLKRVIFHFTKPIWHVAFFIIPLALFYILDIWFWLYFYILFLPLLFLWHKKLDKKLVFTARVKRFFAFIFLAIILQTIFLFKFRDLLNFDPLLTIIISLVISNIFEYLNALKFYKLAKNKLANFNDLKIILITASYGKTSIKNFLFELLKDDFTCHKTPRSVNTLNGLIKDINENLNEKTQIYIAEAGARVKGDIKEITEFLRPQIVIVGEIGEQHIEYFKSIKNIRATKLEALLSDRLERAFIHSSTQKNENEKVEIYNKFLKDINANLDGLSFELEGVKFSSNLLGKFNATNLAVCIKVAKFLGVSEQNLQKRLLRLKNVEHRLEKINAGGKIIIDDSFNGNFAGMCASYELIGAYNGRKVIITPGIIESTNELNEQLGSAIDRVFDLVIISSAINEKALLKSISSQKVIILRDKTKLKEILATHTKAGDLILFSNDAPSFI